MRSRSITTIDGPTYRWDEAGDPDGVPVVLLHGIPTSPALWRDVLPRLRGVRALAFEMVGYGASIDDGRGRDLSLRAQAEHLHRWLDALDLERVVLVGHDLGGGVAQIAAVRRPERFAGLVLTNAVSDGSWPIPAVRAMRAVPRLLARTPDRVFEVVLGTLMARGHDDPEVARTSLAIHHAAYARADGAAAMARQVVDLDVRDTLEVAPAVASLRVPARVVWGVEDRFQPPIFGQRLALELGTRPIAIRGGRHFTPEDHPATIAAAIQAVTTELDLGLRT